MNFKCPVVPERKEIHVFLNGGLRQSNTGANLKEITVAKTGAV